MLFWLKTSTKLVPRQYQLQQNKSTTSHACRHTSLGQTAVYFRLQLCASSIEIIFKKLVEYVQIQLVGTTLKWKLNCGWGIWKLCHCDETHKFVLMLLKTDQHHKLHFWLWKKLPSLIFCQRQLNKNLFCISLFKAILISVKPWIYKKQTICLSCITNILVLFFYFWALFRHLWDAVVLLLSTTNKALYESLRAIILVWGLNCPLLHRELHLFLTLSWNRHQ